MKISSINSQSALFPILILWITFATSFSYQNWPYAHVESQVMKAIQSINQILNFNKNPTFAANAPHTYEDKFTLVEHLVDVALSSHLESFKLLGISEDRLAFYSKQSQSKSIILRHISTEKCNFVRELSREVETGDKEVKEGVLFTTTTKRVRTIKEYFWNFELSSGLLICTKGGGKEDCVNIINQTKNQTLMTVINQSPRDKIYQASPIDLDVTWFFREFNRPIEHFPSFQINRTDSNCFTPVRNRESLLALNYFDATIDWSERINYYYSNILNSFERFWTSRNRGIEQLLSDLSNEVFIPVLPIMFDENNNNGNNNNAEQRKKLMEDNDDLTTASPSSIEIEINDGEPSEIKASETTHDIKTKKSSLFLSSEELNQCYLEEKRTLLKGINSIISFMSEISNQTVVSTDHVKNLFLFRHLDSVSTSLVSGVLSVEGMLERQLHSAIGREVTVDDIGEYMKLRGQQLFVPEYRPMPMTYAVRRSPSHSPEGVLSLERELTGSSAHSFGSKGSPPSPILHTVVRKELMRTTAQKGGNQQFNSSSTSSSTEIVTKSPNVVGQMSFALSDAARIKISGERYIHSYLHHQFGTDTSSTSLSLSFRARQFSSFIVLLGTISSSSSFDPLHAFIIQNKDEMRIPLEMEFIPSIKEFRRAISSLSPEQKQFAEAIRELQMSNTLFGVVVIQIKPQLEKVLNLPHDSLTKEISLTEDLLELFIEYQIPADLLAYDELVGEISGRGQGEVDNIAGVANGTSLSTSVGSGLHAVEKVKEHVKAIKDLINKVKEEELQEKKRLDDFHNQRRGAREPTSQPSMVPSSASHFSPSAFGSSRENIQVNFLAKSSLASDMRSVPEAPQEMAGATTATAAADGGSGDMDASSESAEILEEDSSQTTNSKSSTPSTDLSSLPHLLQNQFDKHGSSQSIRPGIIHPGTMWKKRHQANFFSPSLEFLFTQNDQRKEKQRAFDLLDALTRSGGLTVGDASVHVLLTSSHFFTQSLLETVIQGNMNPLLKLEESTLLMASVIQETSVEELIMESEKSVIRSRHAHLP